jgi:hypothetical protein
VALDDNVAVYDDVSQSLILLNTSAAAVWERCDGVTTLGAMTRALATVFPVGAADIGEDVRQTVDKLRALGLVVDAGQTEELPGQA